MEKDERINDLQIKIARLEEKLSSSNQAVELARQQLELWKIESNNVRDQIREERALLCPMSKADSMFDRITALENVIAGYSGKQSGSDIAWGKVTVILGILFSVVTLILNWQK